MTPDVIRSAMLSGTMTPRKLHDCLQKERHLKTLRDALGDCDVCAVPWQRIETELGRMDADALASLAFRRWR